MPNPIAAEAKASQKLRLKKLFWLILSFIESAVYDAMQAIKIDKTTIGGEYSPCKMIISLDSGIENIAG